MEQSSEVDLQEMAQKIDATYQSVEKMRKFFMWTLIVTGLMFVLPLIGIALLIPAYLNMLSGIASI